MRILAKLLVALILLGIVAAGAGWYLRKTADAPVNFITSAIDRGEVLYAVSATGTIVPEETVDIGAQVAGLISQFGIDKSGKQVDYGSQVGAGDVLALIDDSLYLADKASVEAQLAQSRASVQVAEANLKHSQSAVVQAEAAVQMSQAKLGQAESDWKRAQKLGGTAAMSQSEYENYRSSYDQARAAVDQAIASLDQTRSAVAQSEASLVQSRANVKQAEASVTRVERNLAYCTIKSPVDGVIIDRKVDIGQTVVSSLNAPSLFLIAKDLKRMEVLAPVNEVDIGHIYSGQRATFTVDARAGKVFEGTVKRIRLNASMTQNVVTYMVEVIADNSSGLMLPYMTATVHFEVERKSDVLKVANSALRWTPRSELIAADVQDSGEAPTIAGGGGSEGTLWLRDGAKVRPLAVRIGLNDGGFSEISGEEVREGMEVVMGEDAEAPAPQTGSNPFLPRFNRGGRAGGARGGGMRGGGPPPPP
jgi:HlyD family secretion protein